MVTTVISGGQTGADRAALDAAITASIPHEGWCPRRRKAEDGQIPDIYNLQETEGESYLARTERNVKCSDGTVIFTLGALAGGSLRTADFCRRHKRPWLHVQLEGMEDSKVASRVLDFIHEEEILRFNVAGSSESSEPGIYARVLNVMGLVLNTPARLASPPCEMGVLGEEC